MTTLSKEQSNSDQLILSSIALDETSPIKDGHEKLIQAGPGQEEISHVISKRWNEGFNINDFIKEHGGQQESQAVRTGYSAKSSENDFKAAVQAVQKFLHDKLEDKLISDHERSIRQQTEHMATIGEKEAMNMLVDEIASFLRDSPYQNVKFHKMFDNLAHAIFEHIYRFKNFYKWQLYPESPSAFISGKEIWFKINGESVKQEEEFESIQEVEEIKRLLEQSNPNFSVNEQNPEGELDLADGTRVTITVPPRTSVPTIAFRRFIVSKFSFKEQARRQTIAEEDEFLFKVLARVRANTVIAGAVESGKSTMLKTFYAERDPKLVAILIEEHPETFLKRDFPDRLVHEFAVKEQDIKKSLRTILRFDHDFVIMQEVRGIEAEAAIDGASRGARGLLMTYHLSEPENLCEQLAQHVTDAYPSRSQISETRRAAKTLDLGITMETFEGNRKKIESVFEINFDRKKDKAWISYLMKYDEFANTWRYHDNISDSLAKKIRRLGEDTLRDFQNLLSKRAAESPILDPIEEPIVFKDTGDY